MEAGGRIAVLMISWVVMAIIGMAIYAAMSPACPVCGAPVVCPPPAACPPCQPPTTCPPPVCPTCPALPVAPALPTGILDGDCIWCPNRPEVYIVRNGYKRWFSTLQSYINNGQPSKKTVSCDLLDRIPRGADM